MAGGKGKGKSGPAAIPRLSLQERFPEGEALIRGALEPRPPIRESPEGQAALRRYLSRPGRGSIIQRERQ